MPATTSLDIPTRAEIAWRYLQEMRRTQDTLYREHFENKGSDISKDRPTLSREKQGCLASDFLKTKSSHRSPRALVS